MYQVNNFLSYFDHQAALNFCLSAKSGLNDFHICGKCQNGYPLL